MKQEGYYCYIEDCIVYASDHPEDREHPLGKAIVYSEYDNWGYFYIEGDTIYEENVYTGELEPRGRLVPLDTGK